ncbi:arginase [Selenihalanaerobacter shriftii]|uniref:Arginase n=1 Tax=Selenihalanaerobacter shriftii TaxID=142842 RepID=A0A1T4Q5X8_9FIRM|nr:arginase [Selenihalanaerobacter shriftii]SJZ99074.1 arginase [Selenihalanaerobacter shriftii]
MRVAVIGVPLDLGANKRGVDMGPSAIRYANLTTKIEGLGIEVEDYGDIEVPIITNERRNQHNILEIRDVCISLSRKVKKSLEDDKVPLVIGGDHSIAIGTFSGLVRAKKDFGLIWFDAHADFNTLATSHSGNVHGIPLAVINQEGPTDLLSIMDNAYNLNESNVALIGIRDLDPLERERLKETDINIYTISDIDRLGIEQVMKEAIQITSQGKEGIHLSFDMDVLDPLVAPGVGTAVSGGLNYREAHLAMEILAETDILGSMELVEVNPILDERNRTAELAVELILSVLGKSIL